MSENGAQRLMGWMSCLSDPTRLRLLHLLTEHELGVAELCDVLQLPQSTVSRHLKVLADREWVHSRHRGTANLYCVRNKDLAPGAKKLWALAFEQAGPWPTFEQDHLRLDEILTRRRANTFFAGAAPRWQSLRGEHYGYSFTQSALAALLPAGTRLVDLGCGDGEMAAVLGDAACKVVGVDRSLEMLTAAEARTVNHDNVRLLHGDLVALPLPSDTFDAALMMLALTYLEEPHTALCEMTRVLRPGGRVVIVTLLRHDREDSRHEMGQLWPGFDPDELETMITKPGLKDVRVRALRPAPGATGPVLLLATAKK
ncbi:MAG: metalloregulator ArsR/SmtB family transcription factor [Deltaproteobacteria bacterium]|nr:metalloregulator ArsR/SmtB family transcription factor [Deltaproteobacteria bacterium]